MPSYCGFPPDPGTLLASWNLDPLLLAALGLGALLARKAGNPGPALAGVAVLAVALVSPLCSLSVALFAARSLHHLLIVAVAAPLIAASLPASRRGSVGTWLLISTAVLWAWHVPAAYDAALTDARLYWAMQLSLLVSAVAFWRALAAAPAPAALLGAVGGMAQMGMLGSLLTFAPRPLYLSHLLTTQPWGLDPLADQQLGGLVMWVLGMIPYAAAAAWLSRRAWRQVSAA